MIIPQRGLVRVIDIDPQAARQVARVMEQYDLHNTMYTYQDQQLFACYTSLDTERERQFAAERSRFPQKKWRQVDSLAKTAENERVVFFSMPGPKEKMDCLYAEMEKIPNITLSYYLDTYEPLWYLEIQAGGVDKRLSVEILREMAGADHVVAFGDNHNDLAMGRWSGSVLRGEKRHCRCIGPRRSNRAYQYRRRRDPLSAGTGSKRRLVIQPQTAIPLF